MILKEWVDCRDQPVTHSRQNLLIEVLEDKICYLWTSECFSQDFSETSAIIHTFIPVQRLHARMPRSVFRFCLPLMTPLQPQERTGTHKVETRYWLGMYSCTVNTDKNNFTPGWRSPQHNGTPSCSSLPDFPTRSLTSRGVLIPDLAPDQNIQIQILMFREESWALGLFKGGKMKKKPLCL